MELLSILGQYLLLSFVLPGFCYVAVIMVCFPAGVHHNGAWTVNHFIKDTWTAVIIAGISGLLLSSVAFSIEVALRYFSVTIDCDWFPRIAFEKDTDKDATLNFFAGETFMHLNIALGVFLILLYFICSLLRHRCAPRGYYKWHPFPLFLGLILLVVSNLAVSSFLFHRVADIAYGQVDASAPDAPGGKACRCLSRHGGPGPDCPKAEPKAAASARGLQVSQGSTPILSPLPRGS